MKGTTYMEYWKNTTDLQLPNEIWKPIKGYEDTHVVSNLGRVKRLPVISEQGHHMKERIISQRYKSGTHYLKVTLCHKNTKSSFYVHCLVADAFIGKPFDKAQVNHISEITDDNTVENLEYMSAIENVNYGTGIYRRSITMGLPLLATNLKTGEKHVFLSQRGFADYAGLASTASISNCLNGIYETSKGYSLKYLPSDFDFKPDYKITADEYKKYLYKVLT